MTVYLLIKMVSIFSMKEKQIEGDNIKLEAKQAWVNGKGEDSLHLFTDGLKKTSAENGIQLT